MGTTANIDPVNGWKLYSKSRQKLARCFALKFTNVLRPWLAEVVVNSTEVDYEIRSYLKNTSNAQLSARVRWRIADFLKMYGSSARVLWRTALFRRSAPCT
jgi:hypothetical protein